MSEEYTYGDITIVRPAGYPANVALFNNNLSYIAYINLDTGDITSTTNYVSGKCSMLMARQIRAGKHSFAALLHALFFYGLKPEDW